MRSKLKTTGGRVLVFRQTPGIPNRFTAMPDEAIVPQVGGDNVTAPILAMKSDRFGNDPGLGIVIGFEYNSEQFLQILWRMSSDEFTVMPEVSIGTTAQNGQIKALATGDFDDDGLADVIALTEGFGANLFLCRRLAEDATLGDPETVDAGTLYTGNQLAAVRNPVTTRLDLIALLPENSPAPPAVRILKNVGNGAFHSPVDLAIPTPAGGTTPTPVAVTTGRLTGYSEPYIACADAANQRVVIFRNSGSGYELYSSYSLDATPASIVAADLEADGDDDLIVGFTSQVTTVSLLTNIGEGRFVPMSVPSGLRPRFVTVGDVDGNGLPDILEVGGTDEVDSHLRVIFSNCGGS